MEVGHSSRARLLTQIRRCVPIFLVICVVVVSFAWLNHVNPEFPIWDDGIRDQLLARDCKELGRCRLIGATASVPGFYQGVVWIDLLVAVRLLGGDTATARTVVLILLAVGVGTLFLVVGRWLRPSIALPAAFLLLGALGLGVYPSQLINPSASPFPDTLTAGALVCYGLSGKRRYLILCAFTLGVGINVHIGSISLVPSFLAVAVLASRSPLRGLLAALGVLVATCFMTSRAALLANLYGLINHGRLLPILAGVIVLVLLSAFLGPWFRRLAWNTRAWLIGFILVLPFSAGTLWLVLGQGHAFGITYLHPVLAPAAVLAGALVSAPFELVARWWSGFRWTPTAAAFAGFAVIAFLSTRAPALRYVGPWTLSEATAIADHAVEMGWNYEELPFHIHSTACRVLLAGMSLEAPPPAPGSVKSRKDLQVLVAARDQMDYIADDVISLRGGKVAVLREIDSWLRPEALTACRVPLPATRPPVCMAARSTEHDLRQFSFLSRSFPDIHELDLPPPYVASYQIPLSPVAGETRDLAVADDATGECRWGITRVDGVRVEGRLPAYHVSLHSDTGAPGLLVVEKAFGTPACASDVLDDRYPPCVLETLRDEPLRAVAEGH